MKKKILLPGILAIFLCVGLSGCNYISDLFLSDEDKLIGTWDNDGSWFELPATISFSINKTLEINIGFGGIGIFSEGTWDMNDEILSIEIEDVLPLTNYRFQFTEENKKLTITDTITDESFTLTKQ